MSKTTVRMSPHTIDAEIKNVLRCMEEMTTCGKKLDVYCYQEFGSPMSHGDDYWAKHDESLVLVHSKWQEFRAHQARLEKSLAALGKAMSGFDEAARKDIENTALRYCT